MQRRKKKDHFILDCYLEKREDGKVYKICMFRDKKGNTQISSTLYNPGQYKIEDRNSLKGLLTSIEKGFGYSMDKIMENVDHPDDAARFINQLQSYTEKLIKTYTRFNKELSSGEVESLATEKLANLAMQYFSDGLDENGEKALDMVIEKTNNEILKNAFVYFLSEEISAE